MRSVPSRDELTQDGDSTGIVTALNTINYSSSSTNVSVGHLGHSDHVGSEEPTPNMEELIKLNREYKKLLNDMALKNALLKRENQRLCNVVELSALNLVEVPSNASNDALHIFPAEVWEIVAQHACIDDGETGCSLSLVSRSVYKFTRPSLLDLLPPPSYSGQGLPSISRSSWTPSSASDALWARRIKLPASRKAGHLVGNTIDGRNGVDASRWVWMWGTPGQSFTSKVGDLRRNHSGWGFFSFLMGRVAHLVGREAALCKTRFFDMGLATPIREGSLWNLARRTSALLTSPPEPLSNARWILFNSLHPWGFMLIMMGLKTQFALEDNGQTLHHGRKLLSFIDMFATFTVTDNFLGSTLEYKAESDQDDDYVPPDNEGDEETSQVSSEWSAETRGSEGSESNNEDGPSTQEDDLDKDYDFFCSEEERVYTSLVDSSESSQYLLKHLQAI
ncbi:hypothetical protein AX16_006402, partial [Volvariella volvacea WC 439]